MKKVKRSSFKLNPIAASIVLAMSTQLATNVAYAGSGWGSSTDLSNNPTTIPTYYANSPVGPVPAFDASGNATGQLANTGTPMRKFVDSLPGLGANHANNLGQYIPVATAEKWVNLNGVTTSDDYYEIAAVEFTEKMHSDLPKATHLRGYVQISTPANPGKHIALSYPNGSPILDANGAQVYAFDNPHHLGPIVQATKGTAVRVKFDNYLPVGTGGNLFIPVDTTLTGAGVAANGAAYTQNRAEINMMGANAPWISAGSPHQWVAPAGETAAYTAGVGKGVSNNDVPDMAPAGPGSTTLYFPNDISARFMFYHDKTSGLTRLNSYAGLESAYFVTDSVEQGLIASGLIPAAANTIPLIIEDKTFVPANVGQQDAKWDTTVWGQPGDLWFPHVYETNQDPNAFDGINPVGRWDFGPWFWPIFQVSTPLPNGTSAQPSFTPEAYLDTPVINGTAYPTVTVDPKAYRFKILNASNDRFINLGLYVADSSVKAPVLDQNGNPVLDQAGNQQFMLNTEVKMIPATSSTDGFPASVLRDAAGNMVPDAGGFPQQLPLPAYSAVPGVLQLQPNILFSGTTRLWPTDSRIGGAPDPATAGPDILQIGTDAGLIPSPVDIPSQPVTYEQNRRSVTVTNIYGYGMLLGPAERSDVIIDFSKYAGKTLIVYNDAPAPAPFNDQRNDYFTGDPDQTAVGGTYSTLPGYGPNTRTMMQIVVSATNADGSQITAYDPTKLAAALPAQFAATHTDSQGNQVRPIVTQTAYNAAYGTTDPDTYAHVASGSVAQPSLDFSTTGVLSLTGLNLITSGGTQNPNGTIAGNAVPGAGNQYMSPPQVVLTGGGTGSGATAIATVNATTNQITGIALTNAGSGYTSAPTATFIQTGVVQSIAVSSGGSNYSPQTTVTISAPTAVGKMTVLSADGLSEVPSTQSSQATATPILNNGVITGFTITNPGFSYDPAVGAQVVINDPTRAGTGAVVAASIVVSGLGGQATVATTNTHSIYVRTKTEQELFDSSGRYNSTGGVELPLTSDTTQTTIPLQYLDQPTEFLNDSGADNQGVQIWKIVDNGFWSNSLHFDLADVQLVNRVGWDGTVKTPASNEFGWRDTLRLNPLEDVIIAVRAKRPTVPFSLPQSTRSLDPSKAIGANGSNLGFTADPGVVSMTFDNPPAAALLPNSVNQTAVAGSPTGNFDNEFFWGSNVLGHSEDDFMRPVVFNLTVTTPAAPSGLTATGGATPVLTWVDPTPVSAANMGNPQNELGFKILSAPITVKNGVTTVGAYSQVTTVPANQTSWTISNLGGGQSYEVEAYNVAGTSAASPALVIYGLPPAPTGLTGVASFVTPAASASNDVNIALNWKETSTMTNFSYLVTITDPTGTVVGSPFTIPSAGATSVNYTIPALAESTTYTISVVATNSSGTTAATSTTVTVGASVALAPTTLAVAAVKSVSGVPQFNPSLTWTNAAFNATSIVVSRTGGAAFTPVTLAPTAASFVDTTAVEGVAYTYSVQEVNAATTTANAASSTAKATFTLAVTAPYAVGNLAAAAVANSAGATPTFVPQLTWKDVAYNATSISVSRATGAGAATVLAAARNLAPTATSFVDTTAAEGIAYTYTVTATDAAGSTPASIAYTLPVTIPAAATNLAAAPLVVASRQGGNRGVNVSEVQLTWVDHAYNATSYNIYRNGALLTSVASATAATYTDTTVVGGTAYTYYVVAVDAAGASISSNVVTVTAVSINTVAVTAPTLATPTLTYSAATGLVTVGLTWTDNGTNITDFVLTNNGVPVIGSPFAGATRTASFTLTPGSSYTLSLVAENVNATTGVVSGSAAAVTTVNLAAPVAPAVPTGLAVTASAAGVTTATWTADTAATGTTISYLVYANGALVTPTSTTVAGRTVTAVLPLAVGSSYAVTVAGVANEYGLTGTSAQSAPVTIDLSAPAAPAVPAGLAAAVNATNGAVTLTWTPDTAATGTTLSYTVYNNGVALVPQPAVGINGGKTTATATPALALGSSYSLSVSATATVYGQAVTSAQTAAVTANLTEPTPVAPTGLAATAPGTTTRSTLSWTAVTGATAYVVQSNVNGAGWATVSTITGRNGAAPAATYAATLTAGSSTQFQVIAQQTTFGVTKTSAASAAVTVGTAPAAPTGLTATAGATGSKSITVSWTETTTPAPTFTVQRQVSGSTTWTTVTAAVVQNGTTFTVVDTGLVTGTRYTYQVSATSAGLSSAFTALGGRVTAP